MQLEMYSDPEERYLVDLNRPFSEVLPNARGRGIGECEGTCEILLIRDHRILVEQIYRRAGSAITEAIILFEQIGSPEVNFLAETHEGKLKIVFESTIECLRLTHLASRIAACLEIGALDLETATAMLKDEEDLPKSAWLCRIVTHKAKSDAVKVIEYAVRAARSTEPADMHKWVTKAEAGIDRMLNYMPHCDPEYPLRRRLWALGMARPVVVSLFLLAVAGVALCGIAVS